MSEQVLIGILILLILVAFCLGYWVGSKEPRSQKEMRP